MLGPVDAARTDGAGIGARLLARRRGRRRDRRPGALTGDIVDVVRLTGELLDACGERLRAGDVVITGSAVPPLERRAGRDGDRRAGPARLADGALAM